MRSGRRRNKPDPAKQKEILARVNKERATRDAGYREKALALFPHLCGRCGKHFEGKNLRELTVHHKDGDHFHNPPDGSNWELLCLYCHDDEHQKDANTGYHGTSATAPKTENDEPLTHNPFERLG